MFKLILNTKPIFYKYNSFKRIVFIIGLFLCHFNIILAQSFPFRHFTVEDGLPSSEVYHVFQDSKGYIWFATDNGVSRYDGYEFRNFTQNEGLPDNTVFEIIEDSKNRIWFMPHSIKLSYFYNDSIYEYKYNDTIQSIIKGNGNPRKQLFYVDSLDNVYFNNKIPHKSIIIDSIGRKRFLTNKEPGIYYYLIDDFLFSGNNTIRAETDLLNFSIINDGKETNKKQSFINRQNLTRRGLRCGIKNNSNYLIIYDNVLLIIKNSKEEILKYSSKNIIWASRDNSNNLWLGTHDGIDCYNNFDINTKPTTYLNGKSITSVMQDSEGGYWFTTLYNGVYYLPSLNIKAITKNDGLPNENINSLTTDSSYLWLGLDDKIVGIQANKIKGEVNLDETNIIIGKLFYDSFNQKLWIASRLLYSYRNSNLKINYLHDTDDRISYNSQPKEIIHDNERNLWVASSLGLYRYNEGKKMFLRKARQFNNKINTICLSQESDYILCGNNDGLREYSIREDTFRYIGNFNSLLSKQVNCIINNNFHYNNWIGTKASGIVVYDNDSIFNISIKDGLTSNYITSLYQKDSIIWASTDKGLNKLTLSDRDSINQYSINTYSTIHGIASQELNDIYIDDSNAYIATKKGLSIIDYNNLKTNDNPPPVYIKNIRIQGADTTIQKHYNLPYYKNSINIEYVGLMYRNNENKKYKYRLRQPENQTNWAETTDNYMNFSSLSPGKYTFEVFAINEDGYESNEPATLSFTINPPYWKTWWFMGLIIVGIIIIISGILVVIYFVKVSEIKRRNELERKLLLEVNRFRQQALSQQMNPHFIFNTLNSIQFYIYDNDINSSTQYLSKFSKLMRVILNNSQHDTIPIQKELEAMQLYLELESMRLDNQLNYEIITNDIDVELYQIHPLLIQPYVENSIWHGLVHKKGEKNVKIEIKNNTGSILCIIEDNGIGRKKAMEIKEKKNTEQVSHGTNITGKRIDSINKLFNQDFKVEYIDLKDDKGNACGTKVLLQIPKISN